MQNKWKPLTKEELLKAKSLDDMILNLFLINGWRRNEFRQAMVNYIPGQSFVWLTPKKHSEPKKVLLTEEEQKLIIRIRDKVKISWDNKQAGNRSINRHFKKLEDKLGFIIIPHIIRATNATEMAAMGIPESTIQASMNHKDRKTTQGYIQPGQNEVLIAKETTSEIITLDGMTMHEWRQLVIKKNLHIQRLEYKLEWRDTKIKELMKIIKEYENV